MYDVAIIGGGVMGTIIARALSKFDLKIIIIEKTNDFAAGATKANSGIIHAGYDAPFDSKKGYFNAKANPMFDKLCEDLDVPFKRIGSLVLAHNHEDLKTLEALKTNGQKLKIPGLEILDQKTVRAMEPNVNKDVIAALFAPTAGIVEPWELAIACAENAIDNGVECRLGFEVERINVVDKKFEIFDKFALIESKMIINCAGVYADDIYNMVTDSDFSIRPRRGQYYLLDKTVGDFVNHVIFPCPSDLGKGTLVVPTVNHNIIIGPDSEDLNENEKGHVNTSLDRLELVKVLGGEIVENIPFNENITTFAGLRAEASTGDFIIEMSNKVDGFINVAGMKSPGLSSAPAIAEFVRELVLTSFKEEVGVNSMFEPKRRPKIKFVDLTEDEKIKMIQQNPSWSRIICRCEMITEGEIVDAIHRSAGARSLNGIKRRVRPGSGRCQGGFCGPKVMAILARELEIDVRDVLQENELSRQVGLAIDRTTSGPYVNESMATSVPGIFACGNVVHVHDLVDFVTEESRRAGRAVAKFLQGNLSQESENIKMRTGEGVSYVIPQTINIENIEDKLTLFFRVNRVYDRGEIVVKSAGEKIFSQKKGHLLPGEMESIQVETESLVNLGTQDLTIEVKAVEDDGKINDLH